MIFKEEFIEWHLRSKDKLKINPQPFLDENSAEALLDNQLLEKQDSSKSFKENNSVLAENESINIINSSNKIQDHIEDPLILNVSLQNQPSNKPMVDGVLVNSELQRFIVEDHFENQNVNSNCWHLRPKRADVFISFDSKVDYLAQFLQYLEKCGFDIKNYDPRYHYLPSDLLILDDKEKPEQGHVVYLQQGKSAVWEFLKKYIPEKLIYGKN